jgi:ABC-2 type transport system ATP-binding protein
MMQTRSILRPDSGTITLAGFDVARQPLKARRHFGVFLPE